MSGLVKVDHKRSLDCYRAAQGRFRVLEVPPLSYLMVDGQGDPNTSTEYADALAALYPVAYALKFASKRERDRDYVVMPLEALWWADDPTAFTSARDKGRWSWTAMIMVPDWTTAEDLDAALTATAQKPSQVGPSPALSRLRMETLDEGLCVQTLHVGSYDDEGPVLARMHDEFIPAEGLRMTGRHHEVYLSDARRAAPARLRTILRQPVEH